MINRCGENVLGFQLYIMVFMVGNAGILLEKEGEDCSVYGHSGWNGTTTDECTKKITLKKFIKLMDAILIKHRFMSWDQGKETGSGPEKEWVAEVLFEDGSRYKFEGVNEPDGFQDVIRLLKPLYPRLWELYAFE